MSDVFNPYVAWLGLSAKGPHDHYSLLGLKQYENDVELIRRAAEQRKSQVRRCRPGDQAAAWGQLLDELDEARRCLCDPEHKAAYDSDLRTWGADMPVASVFDDIEMNSAFDEAASSASHSPAAPAESSIIAQPAPDTAASLSSTRLMPPKSDNAQPTTTEPAAKTPAARSAAPVRPISPPTLPASRPAASAPITPPATVPPATRPITLAVEPTPAVETNDPALRNPEPPATQPQAAQVRNVMPPSWTAPSATTPAATTPTATAPAAPIPAPTPAPSPVAAPVRPASAPSAGQPAPLAADRPVRFIIPQFVERGPAAHLLPPAALPNGANGSNTAAGNSVSGDVPLGNTTTDAGGPAAFRATGAGSAVAEGLAAPLVVSSIPHLLGFPTDAGPNAAGHAAATTLPPTAIAPPSAAEPAPLLGHANVSQPFPPTASKTAAPRRSASVAALPWGLIAVASVAVVILCGALGLIFRMQRQPVVVSANPTAPETPSQPVDKPVEKPVKKPVGKKPVDPPSNPPLFPDDPKEPIAPVPKPAPPKSPPVEPMPLPKPIPKPVPPTAPPPVAPSPATPAPRQATAEETVKIRAAIDRARQALAARDMDAARAAIKEAGELSAMTSMADEVERNELLVKYVSEFWRAVRTAMPDLQGTELEVGDTRVLVIESGPDRLLIRWAGTNREFTRRDLPSALARTIAENWMDKSAATKVIVGAFLAVDPTMVSNNGRQKARKLWTEAAAAGAPAQDLLLLLDEWAK
ncbi:MAG: hypothetical protein K8T25_17180 [Planctomycetia bacterium]|nr:hypothetical protein [Planctomycetia bacterium]